MGADGRTIVLTIERNDSYGGKDLYVSFLQPDGIWSEPLNMGPDVNTASTEMSPFLAADGKTLYFSTGGFSGYGSKDMYISRRLDDSWKNWSEPQNLGPAINSVNWDAYYSVPASGEYAYFSSENNSIGKTDIFRIKLPPEMRPEPVVLVRGVVRNQKTGGPLQARIIYEDLETGEEVGEAISHPSTGEYTIVLPAGRNYGFRAIATFYVSVNENMDLTQKNKYEEISRDLALVPAQKGQTVVLNNIFFEATEETLKSSSYPELNRVAKFLVENPAVSIEIGGHTDNTCKEEVCQRLSAARAKVVYDYLTRKGVAATRMTYKGYGSSKPMKSNDTPEGQKANRRVDFTILEM
jgi:outer membrane protein OmpA-like peptidoglycan-associated protein